MSAEMPDTRSISIRIGDRHHQFRVTHQHHALLQKINRIDDHSSNPGLQNNFKRSFIRDAALFLPEENLDQVFEICLNSILQELNQQSGKTENSNKDEESDGN
jgi:hypothetical protein